MSTPKHQPAFDQNAMSILFSNDPGDLSASLLFEPRWHSRLVQQSYAYNAAHGVYSLPRHQEHQHGTPAAGYIRQLQRNAALSNPSTKSATTARKEEQLFLPLEK